MFKGREDKHGLQMTNLKHLGYTSDQDAQIVTWLLQKVRELSLYLSNKGAPLPMKYLIETWIKAENVP